MVKKRLTKQVIETTETTLAAVWGFVAWLTGVIVALAVGFGLVDGVLYVAWLPSVMTQIAGWIVVILTVLGAALAIIDKVMK